MCKAKSLSVNITANLVNQVSAVLFPLITFPYVSRVLRPEGLGRVNFAEAVVSYFIMAATLGIPIYGIRESAKRRDDKMELSTLAAELFLLHLVMTVLALGAFGVFMVSSRRAHSDPVLFWMCALPIIMTPLGFNWLFSGLEEYVYITLRTLGIRILIVAAVFLLIRTEEDYRLYALIAALNTAGAGLVNLLFIRKHISIRRVDWKRLDVWKHLKPAVLIFSLSGIISIYTSLNKVMLGYLTNDAEVGFYSAADRVIKAVVMIMTSMGVVLLPRASYYIERAKLSEYRHLTTAAVRFILFVSFPATAGLIALAGPLMLLLSGRAFEPAIPLVQIMGLNVTVIAVGHFLGYQVLYPQGKERLLLSSVALGAIVNLLLNWLLIPRWHALGAALSTLAAELCVTSVRIVVSRAHSQFLWPIGGMLKYGLATILMAVVVGLLCSSLADTALRLLIPTLAGGAVYVVVLWLLKDSMLSVFWRRLTAGSAMPGRTSEAGM